MFFNKPWILIYLQKNSLQLYLINKPPEQLDFPADLIENLEITNPETFKKLISDFINKYHLHSQSIVIALAPELFFGKDLSITDNQELTKTADDFFAKVPFDDLIKVHKIIRLNNKQYLVASNKDFFQPIKEALENLGSTVVSVFPLTIILSSYLAGSSLQTEQVKQILTNQQDIKSVNLLEEDKPLPQPKLNNTPSTETKLKLSTKIIYITVTALIISAIIGVGLYLTGSLQLPSIF